MGDNSLESYGIADSEGNFLAGGNGRFFGVLSANIKLGSLNFCE